MSVLNLDIFPEIIAAVSLCPIGFAFTFVLHTTPYQKGGIASELDDTLYGPYITIIACAILSCIVMTTMKFLCHKYKFEHFYLIFVGLVLTAAAGISMLLYDTISDFNIRIVVYLIGPGIGFVYVPALAYIFARAKDYRHIKLSLCHIFYFIGFILGAVILANDEVPVKIDDIDKLQVYGYVLTGLTIVIIILVIANEILQLCYKTYFNYKQSIDFNMDYENKFKTIFLKSYFKNATQYAELNLNDYKLNPFKLAGYVIYLIVIKLMGLVYIYYPLLYVYIQKYSNEMYYGYLMSIIGLIASTVLLKFIKIKINFIASLILKIISFLLLILFVNIYNANDLKIFYWIHMIFLLYGYNINDILVLELTKLKYTEIVLTAGLILEMVVNGVLHYIVIKSLESKDGFISITNFESLKNHLEFIIPIVIVLMLVLFITILILPKTHNNTILEIQNIMFFKIHDKKRNGNGTSNHQQKEQQINHDTQPTPTGFVNNSYLDDDDDEEKIPPNARFKSQHLQAVSMSSSTATAEFSYHNNFANEQYPQKPQVISRPPTPDYTPSFDYNQIKPIPIFPRPRPASNNFPSLNRS